MRAVIRMFALVLLLISADGMAGHDFVHVPTGVRLPAELLRFQRGDIIDYEKDSRGQGISIVYRRPGEYTATLTIFTLGLSPFPSSIDDPAIATIRDDTVGVILMRAKAREPVALSANSRHTGSNRWEAPDPAKTPVLLDSFIVYLDGRATNDVLNLWLAKNHLWKLRITREDDAQETWTAFAKAMVQLSVAEPPI